MRNFFKDAANKLSGKKSIPEIEIATFHHAVAKRDYTTLKSMIQTYGAGIVNSEYYFDGKNAGPLKRYSTPLFAAVNFFKEGRTVEKNGIVSDVSAGPQMDHEGVSVEERIEMLKFLLDNGADPNRESKYKSLKRYLDGSIRGRTAKEVTPLEHILRVEGAEKIAQYLLERGAKLPKDAASTAATDAIREVIRRHVMGSGNSVPKP